MRRTAIHSIVLVPLLMLALVSCDQMFSTNLFASLTQKKISADSISSMSVSDVEALLSSTDSMNQLAADQAARQAALKKLAGAYATKAQQATASGQAAAIAAATIAIKTDPDAAQFTASAVSLVASLSFSSTTGPGEVATALLGVLPPDISTLLSSDAQPPSSFVQMVSALTSANGAYQALAGGVASDGGYADSSVGADQKMEIAADAAISGVLSAVKPGSSQPSAAAALWSSLRNPDHASSYLSFGDMSAVVSQQQSLFDAAGLSL